MKEITEKFSEKELKLIKELLLDGSYSSYEIPEKLVPLREKVIMVLIRYNNVLDLLHENIEYYTVELLENADKIKFDTKLEQDMIIFSNLRNNDRKILSELIYGGDMYAKDREYKKN